jgi:hypothetical protein
LQPQCNLFCNHPYFHQVAITLSKHLPSRNMTVSWHEAFFELVFCNRTFYLYFAIVFLQSQSHAVFATVFFNQTSIRLQSHLR